MLKINMAYSSNYTFPLIVDVDVKVASKLVEEKNAMGMKLWVCTDCGFSRHGKWDVRRHIEQKHLELFIQCQLCIATFTRRDKYRAHLKKHSEQR